MSDRDPITLFWFRRDLRSHDNHGLFRALTEQGNVQPIFIFDRVILDKLEDRDDRRVTFIHDVITGLQEKLRARGAALWVYHGEPVNVFRQLVERYPVKAVYVNGDHEPYGRARDGSVREFLHALGIPFRSYLDHTVLGHEEVRKADGDPYTVFTPYSRRWKAIIQENGIPTFPSQTELNALAKDPNGGIIPSLEEIGFRRGSYDLPKAVAPDVSLLHEYAQQRDLPGVDGTSRLGAHLRFGTVSVRDMVKHAGEHSVTWLNELIWREFFMQILWHFPRVENTAFRKEYDVIPWRDDEVSFEAWCEGRTGYPLVDAGMHQLRATGFMHNRVRMVVASFLTKHLLIDWRWGESWFARWLLDYELSSNNGNWQWAAGSGCDAAPYFRVFNPGLQLERFDPKHDYVKRWAPAYGTSGQPLPIVDHKEARTRAIATYKAALA